MLSRLHIKNIALIDEADIEFGAGLNILSGETGSGKSVILDSINFVLGSKTDRSMIRSGESSASVRAEFEVSENSDAAKKLREMDVETDGEIIITRKFSQEGKSSTKINGNTVTAAMLKSVTQLLVDVHGQSEHFYLLDEANQLKVIDGLCGADGEQIKAKLSALIDEKRQIKKKIAELGGNEQERERKLDLLDYQIKDIEKAQIKVGELDELNARRLILNSAEKILSATETVKGVLGGDGGCIDGLTTAIRQMAVISDLSPDYAAILDRLENLRAESEDISETTSDLEDGLSFDAGEAEYVDERISQIKGMLKKYGADEESVLKFYEDAKAKYDMLFDGAMETEKCLKKIEELDEKIFSLCKELTVVRKNRADEFCTLVEGELKSLNIPDARVMVEFDDYDKTTAKLNSAEGSDSLRFLFSANRGEPLKPLSKVISGGEMSRFMLAMKTCLKTSENGISTYIFDEIDAGISGYTANTVAEKFIKIAQNTQIIAVSHLPQVSAASDCQFLIYKASDGDKTVTRIKKLTDEEKVEEIVRLTGSIKSAAATTHAEELIAQFKNK